MSLRAWWHWFRTLKDNPIYQREAGYIGEPNPFYINLRRYAIFFFLSAIILGGCGGISNRSLLLGTDPALSIVWGLVCIPGALISMVTFYGLLMAPSLTVPALSTEKDKGTWDILRLTPHPLGTILLAKTLGGLRRLGIWKWLLILTLIEGLILTVGSFFSGEGFFVVGLTAGLTAVFRPWLEILFSATFGMYLSTWISTAPVTLATTYGGLLLFRMLNNTPLWLIIWNGLFKLDDATTITLGLLSPTVIYIVALILLAYGIIKRAEKYG